MKKGLYRQVVVKPWLSGSGFTCETELDTWTENPPESVDDWLDGLDSTDDLFEHNDGVEISLVDIDGETGDRTLVDSKFITREQTLVGEERIWKVYAKCCVGKTKSIHEDDVSEIIEGLASDTMGDYDLTRFEDEGGEVPEATINMIYEKICDYLHDELDKNGYLSCGDFEIVKACEMPDRPNKCFYSAPKLEELNIFRKDTED